MTPTCVEWGCDRPIKARAMCTMHWQRWSVANPERVRPKTGLARQEFYTWQAFVAMRQRCNNPNYKGYDRIGGKGIRVCARWGADADKPDPQCFVNFFEDMGRRPENTYIRRKNQLLDYTPENSMWSLANDVESSYRESTNGVTGIYYRKDKRRYDVSISFNYKTVHLGSMKTLEEAIEVRNRAVELRAQGRFDEIKPKGIAPGKSGHHGIRQRGDKYSVILSIQSRVHQRTFDTLEEAIAARDQAVKLREEGRYDEIFAEVPQRSLFGR